MKQSVSPNGSEINCSRHTSDEKKKKKKEKRKKKKKKKERQFGAKHNWNLKAECVSELIALGNAFEHLLNSCFLSRSETPAGMLSFRGAAGSAVSTQHFTVSEHAMERRNQLSKNFIPPRMTIVSGLRPPASGQRTPSPPTTRPPERRERNPLRRSKR